MNIEYSQPNTTTKITICLANCQRREGPCKSTHHDNIFLLKIFIFTKPSKLTYSNKSGRCYFKIKSCNWKQFLTSDWDLSQLASNSCSTDAYIWTCQRRLRRVELVKTNLFKTQFVWHILDLFFKIGGIANEKTPSLITVYRANLPRRISPLV